MIDNLFKRLNRKKKLPFSSSSSSKKSRLFWRDTRSPKKEKKDTLEGISISPGKNHEGRYTFQIFFERRISKPRVYRVHSPAALPWNSAPQNSDLSIDIYAVYTHGAYIHIYICWASRAYCYSLSLFARQSSSARCKFPYRTEGRGRGGGLRVARNNSRVTRISARYFFRSVESRDGLTLKREVDWKVEEEDWRKNFGEKNFEFLERRNFFPLSLFIYSIERSSLE